MRILSVRFRQPSRPSGALSGAEVSILAGTVLAKLSGAGLSASGCGLPRQRSVRAARASRR